jgi:cytochrome c
MRPRQTRSRAGRCAGVALVLALALAGCGSGAHRVSTTPATAADPHVAEPFSAQQRRVARGAQLAVADGCAACHLTGSAKARSPQFETFAGHHTTLSDGRRALVDERLVRIGLLHPRSVEIRGYDPEPMIRALARLRLQHHPAQVAALAAFIEEIGPEPE